MSADLIEALERYVCEKYALTGGNPRAMLRLTRTHFTASMHSLIMSLTPKERKAVLMGGFHNTVWDKRRYRWVCSFLLFCSNRGTS